MLKTNRMCFDDVEFKDIHLEYDDIYVRITLFMNNGHLCKNKHVNNLILNCLCNDLIPIFIRPGTVFSLTIQRIQYLYL